MNERERDEPRDPEPSDEADERRLPGDDSPVDDDVPWQERVELEGPHDTISSDTDLDPTLGYEPVDLEDDSEPGNRLWLWLLLGVVALAIAAWWWLGREQTSVTPAAGEPTSATTTRQASPDPALPELDASDEFVRRLVGEIAAHPALTRWLASEQLVRRFVGAVEVTAEGQVPRDNLDFLVPEQAFQAEVAGQDLWRPASASHHRFDEILSVMQLIDPADAARIVRTITPLADQARRELGYPEGGFRPALDRAVAHLARVSPQLATEPLVRQGEVFLYRDTDVEENLSPAQKALLRLGPEPTAWVQAWLHRFHDALVATEP